MNIPCAVCRHIPGRLAGGYENDVEYYQTALALKQAQLDEADERLNRLLELIEVRTFDEAVNALENWY